MASIKLLSKIIRGHWMVDKESSEGYVIAALQLISGERISAFEGDEKKNWAARKPYAVAHIEGAAMGNYRAYDEAPQGSIAVIPIDGVMDKDDYCGIPGSSTLARRVQDADNHPNISSIILKIDSPGGSVDGTENFASVVAAAKKPIVAFVDGLAASAAYWVASGADHIIISGETAKVGSIGTYSTIRDYTKYYEEMGLKIWEVYASKSTDKNKEIRDLIEKGDESTLRRRHLDPLNQVFLNHVSTHRAGTIDLVKENVLSGKIYIGSSAIQSGLADTLGDFTSAINKARELANETSSQSNSIHNMSKPQFKALTALAEKQAKGEAIDPADIKAVNDELQAEGLTAILVVGTSEHAAASAAFKALRAQHEAAAQLVVADKSAIQAENFSLEAAIKSNLAAHTTEVNALNQQITDLKAGTSENPSNPKKEGQEKTETTATDEKKWEEYAHNKRALQELGDL